MSVKVDDTMPRRDDDSRMRRPSPRGRETPDTSLPGAQSPPTVPGASMPPSVDLEPRIDIGDLNQR